jgi:hypothetical protein
LHGEPGLGQLVGLIVVIRIRGHQWQVMLFSAAIAKSSPPGIRPSPKGQKGTVRELLGIKVDLAQLAGDPGRASVTNPPLRPSRVKQREKFTVESGGQPCTENP